jgi:Fe-S cluster assembly protein SufD
MQLLKKEKGKRDFLASFGDFERAVGDGGPPWLLTLRKAARLRFAEMGLPSVQEEEWKYTSLAPLAGIPFRPAESIVEVTERDLEDRPFARLKGHRLVFVNGRFAPGLSSLESMPAGVQLCSLAEQFRKDPGALEAHLGRYAGFEGNAFDALNLGLMTDGSFLRIAADALIEQPIHLVYVTAGDQAVAVFPRNLILAGRNSQSSIVECYVSLSSKEHLTVPVTEMALEEAAVVEHVRLTEEGPGGFHVATLRLQQERSSNLSSHSVTLGGRLVRNNLTAVLDGEGAEGTFNGLYLMSEGQHVDNHTRLEHASPHCSSRELYKGILEGNARGVFHGRIVVHRGAQKTDSKQTNNTILLSDEALINTNPELEIYADDVKCTHGATIGQLDREAIFYLRSRGIGERAARSLLIYAFASQVARRIQNEAFRNELDKYLLGWLHEDESVREAIQV